MAGRSNLCLLKQAGLLLRQLAHMPYLFFLKDLQHQHADPGRQGRTPAKGQGSKRGHLAAVSLHVEFATFKWSLESLDSSV